MYFDYAELDFVALGILILLLGHFVVRRQTDEPKTFFFVSCVLFLFANIVLCIFTLDGLGIVLGFSRDMIFSQFTAYLISLALAPALFVIYLFTFVGDSLNRDSKRRILLFLPALILVLLLVFAHQESQWFFFLAEDGTFVFKPLFCLFFANACFYSGVVLFLLVANRPCLQRRVFFNLTFITVVFFCVLVVQYLLYPTIVLGIGMALCLSTLYMCIQSPENELDPLTGIPGRDSFLVLTERMLKMSGVEEYVLVFCNIARFNIINDLYGRKTGNAVLIYLAGVIEKNIKKNGTYARFESDHFFFCLPAELFDAKELLSLTSRGFISSVVNYDMKMQFGVYEIDDKTLPVDLMCDRARLALKDLDRTSLCRLSVYDNSQRINMIDEKQLLDEAELALDQGEFEIYLQPIYSLASERAISAEALVRWNHPKRGLLAPGVFVPLFERSGFIVNLDRYVLEQVCILLNRWKNSGAALFPISVNISRVDLSNPFLCEEILQFADYYEIEPRLLKFEITESAYMQDTEKLFHVASILKEQGFVIMMDDFGSGYSSLCMLKDTPFDQLKIDMRFLSSNDTHGRAEAILSSVVQMAEALGLFIVAEGIETREQSELLASMGCDAAQGYYYARPMPVESYEALLSVV